MNANALQKTKKGVQNKMEYGSPLTPSITVIFDKIQVRRAVNLMCDFKVDICMKIGKFNDSDMATVTLIGDIETVTKFISSLYA